MLLRHVNRVTQHHHLSADDCNSSHPGRKLPEPVLAVLVAAARRDAEGLDVEVGAHLAHDARAVVQVHRGGEQAEAVQQEELAAEPKPEACRLHLAK